MLIRSPVQNHREIKAAETPIHNQGHKVTSSSAKTDDLIPTEHGADILKRLQIRQSEKEKLSQN